MCVVTSTPNEAVRKAVTGLTPKVNAIRWTKSRKILPTCYPRKDLLERLASLEDRRALGELEEVTNARLRIARGETHVLRKGESFPPECSIYLQAAFAQPSRPSRFCDGNYPVCYSADTLATAVAESTYHRRQFLERTREAPDTFPMRIYELELSGDFHDLREDSEAWHDVYDPLSYAASAALGARLWNENSQGIVYDSVRHTGGQCAAVYSPSVIQKYQLGEILLYKWDGNKIEVFERFE
jgi:hypothetical protein